MGFLFCNDFNFDLRDGGGNGGNGSGGLLPEVLAVASLMDILLCSASCLLFCLFCNDFNFDMRDGGGNGSGCLGCLG